ncbi:MAG: insulinase family protein, partial [Sphingomonadales bacterium]|nr:insulinase family protein [Sphingomonadales bacterium]
QVGGFYGKGGTLAEGALYSNNPAKYREDLATLAALTPEAVRNALRQWLGRPAFTLAVVPGERTERGEQMGGWGDEATTAPAKPAARKAGAAAGKPAATRPAALKPGPRRALPDIAPVGELAFPAVERATLANGIRVTLARRTAVPKVLVNLSFDAGTAADRLDTPGTQATMLALLDEGTTTRSATAIAEEQERLGASIAAATGLDASAITLDALSANLAPSLALMADIVRNPRFAPEDVARVKDQRLAQLAQAEASPQARAMRVIAPVLFGGVHPYGLPADGLGTRPSLAALTPEALRAAHGRWLRPDLARITVVGDVTMAELQPLLEQAFGQWAVPAAPPPAKPLDIALPAGQARVLLVDRPNSPQSFILGGKVLPLSGRDADKEALDLANEVLGNGFLSRLNMDLREDKGWSYGVRSQVTAPVGPRSLLVSAPVQADRTGDALKLLLADMRALPATRPVEPGELARVTDGNIRGLPNRFETNAAVLQAVIQNERLGRPDNYQRSLPERYRRIDAAALNAAARTWLQPEAMTVVIVGDRKLVEPQLKDIGLPVEVVPTNPAGE